MSQGREFYASSNGDRWLLVRDPASGRALVRHEANLASGGTATEIELDAFLARERHSAQNQELMRLIGTLAETSQAV